MNFENTLRGEEIFSLPFIEVSKLIGLSETCQNEFSQFIFQTSCIKLVFSKILGYGVVGLE
jgi:hypothetical protein